MNHSVSLLYKTGIKDERQVNTSKHFQEALQEDLNLDKILDFVFQDEKCKKKATLLNVIMDMETDISNINYRLDITEELLEKPYFSSRILEITSQARLLSGDRKIIVSYRRTNPFKQLKSGAELLLNYLELFQMLSEVLEDQDSYRAEGLQNLAKYVIGYVTSSDYQELRTILQQLRKSRDDSFNFKLSLTRDLNYRLRQAVFIELDNEIPYQLDFKEKRSILGGLFGRHREDSNELVIADPRFLGQRCVIEVIEKSFQHLGGIVSSITSALTRFFSNLEKEMLFYKAIVEMIQTLDKLGLQTCRPQFCSHKSKQFQAAGIYDMSFALHLATKEEFSTEIIVKNQIYMNNEHGQIFIVTGPNQGGKTTYLRTIGIIQFLAQAGIFVPAKSAFISPVDQIFTHFSSIEKADSDRGRLEEEMIRLEQIMQQKSGDSLLLMNESFSSTNSREGTVIAEEILKALSIIGTRVVFVTHLYELATRIDQINASTEGITKLVSMIAGIDQSNQYEDNKARIIKRTYLVKPGKPSPTGFASDIAHQYGISYEELIYKEAQDDPRLP